jgi:hypothetical protein
MRLTSPAAMLLASLAACSTTVTHVDMDATRLVARDPHARPLAVACDYTLGEVVDARADGGEAGGLSGNAFKFDDAVATVRAQLLDAGLSTGASARGPVVGVQIVQLYLAQNLETKVPVAVYRVSLGDEAPFVLRSQKASMNWNGTQNEAYAAYARALADVNRQLVAQLDTRCR